MIPLQPVTVSQNKKIIGLMYEAKNILNEERKKKKLMTHQEFQECTQMSHL
jgi:hypothetical protein